MKKVIIKTGQNKNIKLLKSLKSKKNRHEKGLFFVENHVIIRDALKSGFDFIGLFVTESFLERYPEKFNELKEQSSCPEYYVIDDKLNKIFSQHDTPSGISALYKLKEKEIDQEKPCIYLNALSDPGNLGTIMRTMLAFGFENIVLDEHCVDIYNAKTINAAKDSIFKLRVKRDKERDWLNNIKGRMPIYVSHVSNGEDLDDFEVANNFCLVLGSESHGVEQSVVELADKRIRINISKDIESLNVAIAATIFFYKFKLNI